MSIGLVRPRRRPRTRQGRGACASAPSAREICLMGIRDQGRPSEWSPGARVAWLGRNYRIHGRDHDYVHLAVADGGSNL